MALARTDLQSFFNNLGLDIDNKQVHCFYCGKPLYYKSSKYQCDNLHKFVYTDVAWIFSKNLYDIKGFVTDGTISDIHFVK